MEIEKSEVDKIVDQALDLITKFEGFSSNIYKDVADKVTIGYGTTHPGAIENYRYTGITKEEARELAKIDVHKILEQLKVEIKPNLKNGQVAAVIDFVYNLGMRKFKESSLYIAINDNLPLVKINQAFMKFSYARVNGQPTRLLGLQRRRLSECKLYSTDTLTSFNTLPKDKVNKYVANIEANKLPW